MLSYSLAVTVPLSVGLRRLSTSADIVKKNFDALSESVVEDSFRYERKPFWNGDARMDSDTPAASEGLNRIAETASAKFASERITLAELA